MTVKSYDIDLQLSVRKVNQTKLINFTLREKGKSIAIFQTHRQALFDFLKKQSFMFIKTRERNTESIALNKNNPKYKDKIRNQAIRRQKAIANK